jgi:hypothetical protein
MTTAEWETIERVAKLFKFTIHESTQDFNGVFQRSITDKPDKVRSDFWWNESEGFDAFFDQFYQYAYDIGYNIATPSGW